MHRPGLSIASAAHPSLPWQLLLYRIKTCSRNRYDLGYNLKAMRNTAEIDDGIQSVAVSSHWVDLLCTEDKTRPIANLR